MDKTEWSVPVSLDEPYKLLFLDLHQLMLIVGMAGIGIVADSMFWASCVGLALAYGYGELLAQHGPSYIVRLAHWYLPKWVLNLRRVPPGYLRLFVG